MDKITEHERINKILLDLIPKEDIERANGQLGEFCSEFMGFVVPYYHLSKVLPKDYTIIDFGAGYNAQSYFFQDFKKYIAVNPMSGIPEDDGMLCPKNCEIYRMTTGEFLEKVDYPKDKVFAICNYVPDWYKESSINLVKSHFQNCFTFYPCEL